MKRLLSILSLMCLCVVSSAQKYGYGWPMDLQPASLSSTYGELRRNHFHAGLDWRTGGHSGVPLHAIKEGYVCRVSVSPTGYGNAVYIQHPDGTMSVYGHMERFRSDIADAVKEEQYRQKRYKVVFEPEPSRFPLDKGEVFGWSGNTGSSGGPHLHMEIRKDGDNLPVNYLADGTYTIKDTKPPVISRVGFYAFEDSSAIPMVRRLSIVSSPEKYKGTVPVSGKFYVAIDATDRMDDATGKMAVESYRVYLDSEKVFDFKVGDVPYSEGRYYACLVQQGESGHDLLKTWCPPNNGLLYKIDAVDDGIITLEDDAVHALKIVVADCFGNASSCSFQVKRDASLRVYEPSDTVGKVAALWYAPTIYSQGGMTMMIEPASLNASAYIACEKVAKPSPATERYSDTWRIGDEDMHLQKRLRLRLDTSLVPDDLKDKAYIAGVDKKGGLYYAGNTAVDGGLQTSCRFGTYFVAVDNSAPILSPRVQDGASLPASGRFSIEAADSGSGVDQFDVQMDGEWILSQYVGGRIQVYPDERHRTGGRHTVYVSATDYCGNSSSVEFKVIY
ncbi:MAG: M23 family metallopeptidase [Bacteroidales bacterium]|nr:M23 family metallopeptidase [Bacteroidales bacterium]